MFGQSSEVSRLCARFCLYPCRPLRLWARKEDYINVCFKNPYMVWVLNIDDIQVLHRLRAFAIFSQPPMAVVFLPRWTNVVNFFCFVYTLIVFSCVLLTMMLNPNSLPYWTSILFKLSFWCFALKECHLYKGKKAMAEAYIPAELIFE